MKAKWFFHLPSKANVNIHAIKGNFKHFIDAKSEFYFDYFKVNIFPNQNMEKIFCEISSFEANLGEP